MPGAVSAPGPCWLSASRSKHGVPAVVVGKMPVLNVVPVFSELFRGSIAISTESVRQWRLQSDGSSTVPRTSSVTWTTRYRASPFQETFAEPEQSVAEVQSSPSQRGDRSSVGPVYSPGDSTPSTAGAVVACGMTVDGTSSSPSFLTSVLDVPVVVTSSW